MIRVRTGATTFTMKTEIFKQFFRKLFHGSWVDEPVFWVFMLMK